MNKSLIILIIFLLQIAAISCKKESTNTKESITSEKHETINDTSYSQNRIVYHIDFPDTVYINQPNDGLIKFKSTLDSISPAFGNKQKNRYVRFILTKSPNVNYGFDHLKRIVKDTFGASDNRTIPFYNIKFNKEGVYYIDGVINDVVLISLNQKDKGGNDLSRLIEDEERVIHKVVVIKR